MRRRPASAVAARFAASQTSAAVLRRSVRTKALPSGGMLSAPGLWAQSWPMLQYNPSQLLSRQGIAIFDTMLLDDQIKAAISFKTESVLATGWQIVSPESKPPAWEVTRFVRRRLDSIMSSFERCLRNMLSAMIYGYSITEKVLVPISDGDDKGLVGIKDLKTKAPHYLRFRLDEIGNVEAVLNDHDNEAYDPRKFVIWSYGDRFGNPYGMSDLEACYRAYILSHNSYKWLGQYLERLGIPPWFALYNPEAFQDPQQLLDLKKVMVNLQNATSAAVPRPTKDDFEIWTPGTASSVHAVFVPALDMLKKDIARALLMPGHLGVTPDATQGSLAKARVALDMFLLSLTAIQTDLSEIVQHQLVEPLVDFNFGSTGGAYPQFSFMPLSTEDAQTIITSWAALVDRDIVSVDDDDEQHIRELLDFPRKDADDPEEAADPDTKPRIPLRYLDRLGGALKVNEVRAALGLDPIPGEEGEQLVGKALQPEPMGDGSGEDDGDGGDGGDEPRPRKTRGGRGAGGSASGDESSTKPQGTRGTKADSDDKDPVEDKLRRSERDASGEPNVNQERDTAWLFAEPGQDELEPEAVDLPSPDDPGLTAAERRVDLAAVQSRLDGLDQDVTGRLARSLRTSLTAQLAGWLIKPPSLKRAAKVQASVPVQLRGQIRRGLRDAFTSGRQHVRREAAQAPQQNFDLPTFEPDAALDYLEAKADFYVTGLSSRLTEIIRGELLFGLRNGLPFTETRNRILGALVPWIGEPEADPAQLSPARLLTVTRTNITDAYNQGRVVEARRLGAKGLVTGMQHSSILDRVTTPICRSLHGRCYRIDDPVLDQLTPPLHYNCRSILLPITLDIEISSDANDPFHWATPEEIAAAKRMVPGEFGGSFRDTKRNGPKE